MKKVKSNRMVRQIKSGKWAVWNSKSTYFAHTVRDTEREALVEFWRMKACNAQAVIDRCDDELRKLGAFDERDPHGYMA